MATHHGSCHCGSVRFEIDADIDHVRSCDCSICRRRAALNHRVPKENLRLLTPWSELALYQWGSRTAKDYFCPACGILVFRRPADPTSQERREGVQPFDGWAVNVRCLDGVDVGSIPVRKIFGSRIVHDVPTTWGLFRLDDNGNRFPMSTFRQREAADQTAADYERRGHKQTYTVESVPDDGEH